MYPGEHFNNISHLIGAALALAALVVLVVLIALYPLIKKNLPTGGLVLLVFGGLCYTGGLLFYGLDEKLAHAHGIWHLFVLAGSISHFHAILLYVL